MEIRDLTQEERLALVALVAIMVESDRNVSNGEIAKLDRVVAELGAEEFHRLGAQASARYPDEDALKVCLLSITRQEARDLIYGLVLDIAVEESVDPLESELLGWLAQTWHVRVDFVDEPSGD